MTHHNVLRFVWSLILFFSISIQTIFSQQNYFVVTMRNDLSFDHKTWTSNFDDFSLAFDSSINDGLTQDVVGAPIVLCSYLLSKSDSNYFETVFYFTYENSDDANEIITLISLDAFLIVVGKKISSDSSISDLVNSEGVNIDFRDWTYDSYLSDTTGDVSDGSTNDELEEILNDASYCQTHAPTDNPSNEPSLMPTTDYPSISPSLIPSLTPTTKNPSISPSLPSSTPTAPVNDSAAPSVIKEDAWISKMTGGLVLGGLCLVIVCLLVVAVCLYFKMRKESEKNEENTGNDNNHGGTDADTTNEQYVDGSNVEAGQSGTTNFNTLAISQNRPPPSDGNQHTGDDGGGGTNLPVKLSDEFLKEREEDQPGKKGHASSLHSNGNANENENDMTTDSTRPRTSTHDSMDDTDEKHTELGKTDDGGNGNVAVPRNAAVSIQIERQMDADPDNIDDTRTKIEFTNKDSDLTFDSPQVENRPIRTNSESDNIMSPRMINSRASDDNSERERDSGFDNDDNMNDQVTSAGSGAPSHVGQGKSHGESLDFGNPYVDKSLLHESNEEMNKSSVVINRHSQSQPQQRHPPPPPTQFDGKNSDSNESKHNNDNDNGKNTQNTPMGRVSDDNDSNDRRLEETDNDEDHEDMYGTPPPYGTENNTGGIGEK